MNKSDIGTLSLAIGVCTGLLVGITIVMSIKLTEIITLLELIADKL